MTRSTWLHLRIRVSFFLFPVFAFALSQMTTYSRLRAAAIFAILHLLVYPASNGFNSYYDRDQGSIGGLESPPPITRDLLLVSLAFDAVALALGLLVGPWFALMLLIFGLASKAYSHPAIRLKSSAWGGWITVTVFQGAFTYLMVVVGVGSSGLEGALRSTPLLVPAILSSVLFGGAYPLTQVYQHAEDLRRGDRTLSVALGVRGTFLFSAAMFAASVLAFLLFFDRRGELASFYLLLVFLFPVATYFGMWLLRVVKDESAADFRSTMKLNTISAASLSCYFLFLTFLRS